MPDQQRSAGFVLYRIDPANPASRQYLLLDYGTHWDYPKGHLQRGESDLAAAHRELLEETGIDHARVIPGFAREIRYVFRSRKGRLIDKTVIFFLGQTDTADIRLSDEHVGYAWLELAPSLKQLTYASARELLTRADEFLAARPSTTD